MNFIEMRVSDIPKLREKIWLSNNKKCPVLGKEIPLDKTALDHAHKRKDEEYSENKGVIREVLDFRCNSVLGQLENSLKRTGLIYEEGFDIGSFLRNAADYFDRGAYKDEDGNMYIHPKEVTKEKKLQKSLFNKIAKQYKLEKNKILEYPKSGKATKLIKELANKYGIDLS